MADFNWSFGGMGEPSSEFSASVLRAGELFGGRFKIDGPIGEGASGQVFAARDIQVGRTVAIKVLRDADEHRARFARESQLTASLRHQGIVRVHGGGLTVEGTPFLILELVEGAKTLEEYDREHPEGSLDRLIQVARAVGYAHERGIVHRDLKPNNVLVGSDVRVRVCDFGLAWRKGVDRLTKTGAIVGTPLYMAPERFLSTAEAGPTSDVWSLGVMLYEALTGQVPFGLDGSFAGLMAEVARADPPPPRSVARGVSRALEAVCLCALDKDSGERYMDANQFADALEDAMLTGEAQGHAWAFVGYLAIAAVAGAVLFAVWPTESTESPPPEPERSEAPLATQPEPALATPTSVVRAARALIDSARDRAHQPRGFDQSVIDEFESARRLVPDDRELGLEIDLHQLGYLFRRGRWEEVCNLAPRLHDRPGPKGMEAGLLHVMALYELMRREEGAKLARRLYARSEGRQRQAIDYAVGAWGHVLAREPDAVAPLTRLALTLEPGHLPSRLADGVAAGLSLQIFDAMSKARELRLEAPDHPTVLRVLISVYVNLQRYEAAVRTTDQLVRLLEPRPPLVVLRSQARVYSGGRRLEEARRVYLRILAQEPGDVVADVELSVILLRVGEQPEAQRRLQEARKRDPRAFEQALEGVEPDSAKARLRELAGSG